jgi:hypothetical protein
MRCWIALFFAGLWPASAFAVGRDEASLSAGAGLAVAFQDGAHPGAQAELRLLRGLSDSWSGRLGVQAVVVTAAQGSTATSLVGQSAGLTWALDVVNWVPFVDFGVVVADVRGGGYRPSQHMGGQAGFGFDYLASRHWVLSMLARVDYFPLRLSGADRPRPTLLSLGVHLGRTF